MNARLARAMVVIAAFVAAMPVPSLVAQEKPDRTVAPALAAAPNVTLPSIDRRLLSNGVRVWLVEAHEVPLVQVNLVITAGSGDDSPGRYGLASLTSAMLDEGAGARSALAALEEAAA